MFDEGGRDGSAIDGSQSPSFAAQDIGEGAGRRAAGHDQHDEFVIGRRGYVSPQPAQDRAV